MKKSVFYDAVFSLFFITNSYGLEKYHSDLQLTQNQGHGYYQLLMALILSQAQTPGRAFCAERELCYFIDCNTRELQRLRCSVDLKECWQVPIDSMDHDKESRELLATITCNDSRGAQKVRTLIAKHQKGYLSRREQIQHNNRNNYKRR